MSTSTAVPDGPPEFLKAVLRVKYPELDVQDFRTCTRLPKPAWQAARSGREGAIRHGEAWLEPTRWSKVAMQNGAEMHSTATWKDVCGPTDEQGSAVNSSGQGWAWPPGSLSWYAPRWTYALFNTLSSENETVICGISGMEVREHWDTYHALQFGDQQCALYKGPIWSVRNWLVNDQHYNRIGMPCLLWPNNKTGPRWLLINSAGREDIFVLGSKNLQKRLVRGLESYEVAGVPAQLEEGVVVESRDDTPGLVRVLGSIFRAINNTPVGPAGL